MPALLNEFPQQLNAWLDDRGQPAFRAAQITQWLFHGRADDFEQMTNLPQQLRSDLAQSFDLWSTSIAHHQHASDGTEKLLVKCGDAEAVECVLLRDGQRRTICVSSQVGCAMGCVFCASGLDGVKRNLSEAEILEQMLRLQRLLPAEERLSHIVMMGMGEPLANLDNVLAALHWAQHPKGLGISARRITISTVGIPAAIRRLANHSIPYHLAVSLHAANDQLRNRLVPVNQNTGLQEILAAADEYFETTGRRLTFEYVMLAGINDGRDDAEQLAALIQGRTAMLNLIPYNPVSGLSYQTPAQTAVVLFRNILERAGITVQVRERKGDRIDAACGQLRRTKEQEQAVELDLSGTRGPDSNQVHET